MRKGLIVTTKQKNRKNEGVSTDEETELESTPAIPTAILNQDPTREELEKKRNDLINELRPKLVTKRQMVVGGRIVRSQVSQEESNYRPVVDEINKIGLELGIVDVNIGMLRRD